MHPLRARDVARRREVLREPGEQGVGVRIAGVVGPLRHEAFEYVVLATADLVEEVAHSVHEVLAAEDAGRSVGEGLHLPNRTGWVRPYWAAMTTGTGPTAPQPGPDELRWRFGTSGGPGGQHANRTETRVEVTFDIDAAKCLTVAQRNLLAERLGPRIVVACDETRSQWRNRQIAYERLCERIASALEVAPARVATRPGKAAGKRRIEAKRRRGEQKNLRRPPDPD